MFDFIEQQCLSYFLCHFDPEASKRRTIDVTRQFLKKHYSEEKIDEFLDAKLSSLQSLLVAEYNQRSEDGRPLRYKIVDRHAEGSQVEGLAQKSSSRQISFQNALKEISATDFERLSAVLLRKLGCETVFFTPSSHDQGIDAFGYKSVISDLPYGVQHKLTWIAQAKHYQSTDISSNSVRDLVGARELLLARVFSTVDDRYSELTLRRYGPTALALVTSEEVPTTVRRMSVNAGIFVFASSDLYEILKHSLAKLNAASLKGFIEREARTIQTLS